MRSFAIAAWILGLAAFLAPGCAADRSPPAALSPGAMEKALDAALGETDTVERAGRVATLVEGLDAKNLPGALAAIERRMGVLRDPELRTFVFAWTKLDAQGALDRVNRWPDSRERRAALSEILYGWALVDDPQAAGEALHELAPADRVPAAEGLVVGWARRDPDEAARFLEGFHDPGHSRDLLSGLVVAETLRRQGVESALRWAEGIPDDAEDDYKRVIFSLMAREVARRNPRRAAAWVEAHAAKAYTRGATQVVFQSWLDDRWRGSRAAGTDPDAAVAWVLSRPPGSERNGAIASGFSNWLRSRPEEAAAWLRGAEWQEGLSPAAARFVRWLATRDPEEAAEWTRRVTDEDERLRAILFLGRVWVRADPQAARVWLASVDLPDEQRRAILRGRERVPPAREHPRRG